MSPDLPIHFRELTADEPTALGSALDDGYVVVSDRLRDYIERDIKKQGAKARRRQANQSRRRNRGK